jgi:hypothetical protein
LVAEADLEPADRDFNPLAAGGGAAIVEAQ